MFKMGAIGYIQQDLKWEKCIVVGACKANLIVRISPDFTEKNIHIDDFLSQEKAEMLAGQSLPTPVIPQKVSRINQIISFCKRALFFNENRKTPMPILPLRTGLVGWVKVKNEPLLRTRKIWTRCLIVELLEKELKVCVAPDFKIITTPRNSFIIECCIEYSMQCLNIWQRLQLRLALRDKRIPYKIDPVFYNFKKKITASAKVRKKSK